MNDLNSICVFCGSSDGNDDQIIKATGALGEQLAARDITLVYGAAKIGLMGLLAKTVLENGGKVTGVIPGFLKKKEVVHLGLTNLITTHSMHERKLEMHNLSDGFIALPGGIGTLEELFEIFSWLQLGLHAKPIGLLNTNGFYDDLIQLLETMVRKGFLSMENYELLLIDSRIDGLFEKMANFKPPRIPQWMNEERS
jgi:uncharacterized protein (TIGR00730 family)